MNKLKSVKDISIESPLSAFNNVLLQISNKLQHIYIGNENNISFINQLLFEEKSITICNVVKLVYKNNEIGLKFQGVFVNTDIIEKTLLYKEELFQIFKNYLFTISVATKNLDDGISQKQVSGIFEQINNERLDFDNNQIFIVPHKIKIRHLYDEQKNDKTLDNIFNRYSYIIKFQVINKNSFRYSLCRVISTILNESKSIENIKFEEIDIIKSDVLGLDKLKDFLIDLFYYGEIK